MVISIIFYLIVSIGLLVLYIIIAKKYGIVAVPNHRSSHTNEIPKGGGLVVYIIYIIGNIIFVDLAEYSDTLLYISFITFGIIFGFVDDCCDLSAKKRLLFQISAAILPSMHLFNKIYNNNTIFLTIVFCLLALFLFVWFINLINFVDGTNGMASFMSIYISFVSLLFVDELILDINLKLSLLLLGISFFIILPFNFPIPNVFIGDSGTNLFSISLLTIMISTITVKPINVIYWAIAFSYYFTDTSITTFIRLLKYKLNFYKPHRSHAYQNCASEWGSHGKILLLVIFINILWVTPILLIALNYPSLKIICMVICYIPLIMFTLYKGPLNSAK